MLYTLFTLLFLISSPTWASCLTITSGLDRFCARNPKEDSQCWKAKKKTYGFHEESCFVKNKSELIQDILKLEAGEPIPDKIILNSPVELIVKTLLFKNFQENIRPTLKLKALKKPLRDVYQDSELQIAFNLSKLALILKNGFKNQHQTGTTNGAVNKRDRTHAEDILIGAALEDNNLIRPKYSYLGYKTFFEGYTPGYYAGYGEVIAVLKNSVKSRATVTRGDSLVIEKKNGWTAYFEYRGQKLPLIPWETYYEAQIWGPLEAQDISHFLIGCFESRNETIKKTEEKILAILAESGQTIPVYTCAIETQKDQGSILTTSKK